MNMRRAFTLMEINLAMLIMATGVLAVVGLYSMGFRESQQSTDDVASAAYAEAVISPLVRYFSDTNMTWDTFKKLKSKPSDAGWRDYLETKSGNNIGVRSGTLGVAQSAFGASWPSSAAGVAQSAFGASWPSSAAGGLKAAGLVILHDEDSAVVRIGFRAAESDDKLMAAPLYYTEVRFQGRMP